MDWPKIGVWAFVLGGCIFFWYVIVSFVLFGKVF
jgi:hypothetical protein